MSKPRFVRSGRRPRGWIILFGIASSALFPLLAQSPPSQQSLERRLLGILGSRCQACHNSETKLGDLALDSEAGLRQGGVHGPVVVPGEPQASRLYRRVARLEEPFMPMQGEPLENRELSVIKEWIEAGAGWPAASVDQVLVSITRHSVGSTPESTESSEARFFREHIHPILRRCQSCHDDALKYYGLSLETRESLLYGGLDGPALVPGEPEASRLYRKAARLEPHFMPSGPVMLTDQEIHDLYQWIKRGANWPDPDADRRAREREARIAKLKPFEKKEFTSKDRAWWAFQPPVRSPVPVVRNQARVSNEIDAFVLAAQERAGVDAAPLASPETLLRRAYFDLIGLPPTPEERSRFLNDSAPGAYERLVKRLLASRHYGERWGRYWLDVARYADSDGYEYDKLRPNSWRYRDYVIRAFNEDKPFDRFLREQLAGDELGDRDYDAITALGFLRNGPFIGDMLFMQNEDTRQDELDDIVSTTGAAMLGLTVGCARCHNHKYDPIAQRDYYRMVAIFAPSARKAIPLASLEKSDEYFRENNEIDRQVEDLKYQKFVLQDPARRDLLDAKYQELPKPLELAVRTPAEERTETQARQAREVLATITVSDEEILEVLSDNERERLEALETEIQQLEESRPLLPLAQAVSERGPVARPTYFLHRGNVRSKGSAVEPGTLSVLNPPGQDIEFPAPEPHARSTGRRLALAKWIASPANPLTARVMVNRIWQHHFGRGIVATPNNFGTMGEQPTHPALLDWLATEFMRSGWSVKAMHRLILLSQTYRQDSVSESSANRRIDPENRLLWRMPVRRLEGEIIRDAILAVSGGMNFQSGGPPVFPAVDNGIIEGSPKGETYQRWPRTADEPTVWKRSVYVAQMRTITPPILDLFDPPDKLASCARRATTTVPTQALQLLNNSLVARQAALFADRVRNEAGPDVEAQVERAFVLALARLPTKSEFEESIRLLETQQAYHAEHNQVLRDQAVEPSKIPAPEMGALVDLCHGLFNINEFIYVN